MNNNLYKVILGPSGSGKTTLINKKIEEDKYFGVKTATTGRAALIGSEGRTINNLLGYNNETQLIEKVLNKSIYKRLKYISEVYKNILIDEISMASSITINYLYIALNNFNKNGSNPPLGLILTGDFAQLPHVNKGKIKSKPAFESEYWKEFKVAKLNKVKRQTDLEYIKVLSEIRKGKSCNIIDWIIDNIGFEKELDINFEGTTIFTTNKEVNEFNNKKLLEIDKPYKEYKVKIKGVNPPLDLIGGRIQDTLILKEGCLVYSLVNNLKEGYANGSLGIVLSLKKNSVVVKILNNNKIVDIGYNRIDNKDIKTNKSLGYISFIPLRLGFASTVHSIQGTSIKDNIQFKVSNNNFLKRLSGGLYVVMSRAVDYKKIKIIGTPKDFVNSNYLDKRYLNWI